MRGLAFSLITLLSAICSGPAQTISIGAPDPSASETGVDAGLFRISRTGDTTLSLTVSIVFSGTGTAGTDYAALSSTITIPAGQTSSDMVLNPINDATVESADDTVTATLQSGVGYLVGAPASATVTIANNDAFDTTCPLLLSATATSSSNITITWTDNFQTGTKFRVRRSTDQTTWTGFDAAANATAHTFTGLTPGTVYYFEVPRGEDHRADRLRMVEPCEHGCGNSRFHARLLQPRTMAQTGAPRWCRAGGNGRSRGRSGW